MATLTPQEAAALGTLLQKVMGGSGYSGKNTKTTSEAFDKYKKTDGDANSIDFDKLKNIVKNNGSLAEQLGATLKDMSSKGKAISGLFKELEQATRSQNATQRKAAQNMADMIEKSKNSITKLEQVTRILNKAETRLANSETVFNRINKLNNERKQLKSAITKGKNKGEFTDVAERKLKLFDKSHAKELKDLNLQSNKIVNSFKLLNKVTGTLSKDQLKDLGRFSKMTAKQREQSGVYDVLRDSMSSLNGSTKFAAQHIEQNTKSIGDSFKTAGNYALAFGKALLTMIPGLYHGMMAKQKYNVGTSGYTESGWRGMKEEERAEIIGTNRIGLRALGDGNAEQGFSNSQALQNTAHIFGVTGAEALKKALSYQQTSMGMGIKASDVKGQQLQMSFMHDFSKQIGATDEELQNFYGSLSDMGEMAALNQKYADKTDDERTKSINAEVTQRLKLNRAMGVTIEQQKEMQQSTMNQRFAGIANIIKSQITGNMLASTLNRSAPGMFNKSDSDFFSTSMGAVGIDGELSNADDQARYEKLRQQAAIKISGDFKKAQDDQASGKNPNALINLNAQYAPITEGMHMNLQDFANKYSGHALRGNTQGSTAISGGTFDEMITNAAKHMDGPDGFNEQMARAAEILQGFNKSPIGGSGGVASFIGGVVANVVGNKLLKYGARAATRVLGGNGTNAGRISANVNENGIFDTIKTMIRGKGVVPPPLPGGGKGVGTLGKLLGVGSKASKFLGDAAAPITAIMGAYGAGSDVLSDNGSKFKGFTESLGLDSGKSAITDTVAQTANVFNHIGNGLTVGAAGKLGSDPIGWLKHDLLTGVMAMSGHPIDALKYGSNALIDNPFSSNDKISNADQSAQQEKDRTNDENAKHLATIAKNTADQVALSKKADNKDQQDDQALKAGNIYDYYKKHLDQMKTGLNG